jgi:hypothetical protein
MEGRDQPASGAQFAAAIGRWVLGIIHVSRSPAAPHEDVITTALAERARDYFGERVQVEVKSNVISLKSHARAQIITPALTLRTHRGPEGMERLLRGFGVILRDWPEPPTSPRPERAHGGDRVQIDVGDEMVTVWWLDRNGTRVAIEPFERADTGL